MGSPPYEDGAIKIYPHLLKGITSKDLDYDIIVMIVLSDYIIQVKFHKVPRCEYCLWRQSIVDIY
jgi:hypothetical protein